MMTKIKTLYLKYKEIILYGFFGVCTTALNIIIYFLLSKLGCGTTLSTVAAWFLSVLFAFVTNRLFVFESQAKEKGAILRESLQFFGGRLATGALDLFFMVIFVDILLFNGLVIKILSNVLVIVLNYIISKFYIFKEKEVVKLLTTSEKISGIIQRLPSLCAALFLIYIIATLAVNIIVDKQFLNAFSPNELTIPNIALFGISLLLFAALLLAVYFLAKKRKPHTALSEKLFFVEISAVFVLVFCLQLLISYNIWFKTGWDVGIVVNAAEQIAASGNNSLATDAATFGYFNTYTNNIPLVYTLVGILKIGALLFQTPYTAVLIVNALIVCLSVYLSVLCVYKMTNNRVITRISMVIGILLIALSPWIIIPYSDTFAMLFPVFSIFAYLYFKNPYIKYFAVTLASLIGYLYKPTVLIVCIALVIVELCRVLSHLIKKQISLKRIGLICVSVCLSFIMFFAYRGMIHSIDQTELDPNAEFTMTHFLMMGANTSTDGFYAGEDVAFSASMPDQATRSQENMRIFLSRIKEMGGSGFFKHLLRKNILTYNDGMFYWGREGHFYTWGTNEKETTLAQNLQSIYYSNNTENNRHLFYATAMQILWLMLLLSICFCLIGKKSSAEILIAIALLGLSAFLLLFECRSRYLFPFLPLFLILGSVGLNKASAYIGERFRKTDPEGNTPQSNQ